MNFALIKAVGSKTCLMLPMDMWVEPLQVAHSHLPFYFQLFNWQTHAHLAGRLRDFCLFFHPKIFYCMSLRFCSLEVYLECFSWFLGQEPVWSAGDSFRSISSLCGYAGTRPMTPKRDKVAKKKRRYIIHNNTKRFTFWQKVKQNMTKLNHPYLQSRLLWRH